uniref:Uncharacterized protein n=1 Tax=viral metagenome TaxID=1070528 RepID=A0A6M3LQH2_9ZZZZ
MVTEARLSLLRELSKGDRIYTRDRNRLADALVVAGLASVTSGAHGNKRVMTYVYSITAAGRKVLENEAE